MTAAWISGVLWAAIVATVLWNGGKTLESTWLLVLLAALSSMSALRRSLLRGTVSRTVTWSIGTYVALSVLAFAFSKTKNYGLDEILRDFSLMLLLFWIVRRRIAEHAMGIANAFDRTFMRILMILAIAGSIIGCLVYVLQPINRFVGIFFDYRYHTDYWPNAWADFLLLSVMAILLWRSEAVGIWNRALRTSVLGFVLGCFFLSYSRGGLLVLCVQFLLLAGIKVWTGGCPIVSRDKLKRFLQAEGIAFLATIVAALVTFTVVNSARSQFHPVQNALEKVTFTADEGKSSVTERSQFFSQAFRLSFDHPFLGYGPYAFRFVQPKWQTGVFATSDHPHNVFLKIAMERGWPALIAYVVFLGSILFPPIYKLLRTRLPLEKAQTYALIGVIGVLLHNQIDYNLQFVGIILPLTIMLGIIASANVPHERLQRTERRQRCLRWGEIGTMIALLYIAGSEVPRIVAGKIGRHAERSGEVVRALSWYEHARGGLFSRDALLSATHLSIQAKQYAQAEEFVLQYQRKNSEDARGWKARGEVALYEGKYAQALAAYEQAYERGKYNDLGILRGILESALQEGNRAMVREKKAQFEVLLTEYKSAILHNTHFIALTSNVEEFGLICNILADAFPSDAKKYAAWQQETKDHAQIVRGEIQSRARGYLW